MIKPSANRHLHRRSVDTGIPFQQEGRPAIPTITMLTLPAELVSTHDSQGIRLPKMTDRTTLIEHGTTTQRRGSQSFHEPKGFTS